MNISLKRFGAVIFSFILSLTLLSCSAQPAVKTSTNTSAAPAPGSKTGSPTWTVDASKGTVKGILKLKGVPQEKVVLGLGDVIKSKDGLEIATSFSWTNSPQAETGSDGSFTFSNVPPGRYGLIYTTDIDTFLLLDPESDQKAVLVSSEAGNVVDLGVLDYKKLPGVQ